MKWLRQHKWTLIISVLLFLGITNCQNLDQSKHSLSYSSYQIPSDKIDTPIRILQLTDLHNSEFGEDNQELIDRIEADLSECMFLWDFENTDRYKILLSHLPIAWLKNDALEEWNMDCVFSGHLHGGQVILPGIGGVYAPDMGWFPGRLKGVFDSKDGKRHLVLSAGLGNTEVIPRFNNIPEIVCVDLVPEGGW